MMNFTKGTIYKMNPEIEESDERYEFSHLNEYGSAFFNTVNKIQDVDEYFWLSSVEVDEDILIEA
jgi:hypothetical protein